MVEPRRKGRHFLSGRVGVALADAALALAACTPGTKSGTAPETPLPPARVIATVGASLNDSILGAITDALLFGDKVVVADGPGAALHVFDTTGRHLARIGRSGAGPGEFLALASVHTCGTDSLFTWDAGATRMSVFDSAGRYVRQFRLPVRPAILKCSLNGEFGGMAMPENLRVPSAGSPTFRGNLTLWDRDGSTIAVLGNFLLGDARPLGRVSRIAVGRDRIVVGEGEPEVGVFDRAGARVATIVLTTGGRRTTSAQYEASIDRMGSALDQESQKQFKQMMLAVPMPEYLPPYSRMAIDPLDRVWITTSLIEDSATTVSVYGIEGVYQGDLTLPAESEILNVGPSHLLIRALAGDEAQLILQPLPSRFRLTP